MGADGRCLISRVSIARQPPAVLSCFVCGGGSLPLHLVAHPHLLACSTADIHGLKTSVTAQGQCLDRCTHRGELYLQASPDILLTVSFAWTLCLRMHHILHIPFAPVSPNPWKLVTHMYACVPMRACIVRACSCVRPEHGQAPLAHSTKLSHILTKQHSHSLGPHHTYQAHAGSHRVKLVLPAPLPNCGH